MEFNSEKHIFVRNNDKSCLQIKQSALLKYDVNYANSEVNKL